MIPWDRYPELGIYISYVIYFSWFIDQDFGWLSLIEMKYISRLYYHKHNIIGTYGIGRVNPYAASQYKMMQKTWKMIEILSSESTQWELSN